MINEQANIEIKTYEQLTEQELEQVTTYFTERSVTGNTKNHTELIEEAINTCFDKRPFDTGFCYVQHGIIYSLYVDLIPDLVNNKYGNKPQILSLIMFENDEDANFYLGRKLSDISNSARYLITKPLSIFPLCITKSDISNLTNINFSNNYELFNTFITRYYNKIVELINIYNTKFNEDKGAYDEYISSHEIVVNEDYMKRESYNTFIFKDGVYFGID